MPKVSVIIPCYNHGQYIDDAVDSVLGQTWSDFEIIIVNDGSTDALTNEKLQGYDRPSTRVFHTPNQGPSQARNWGITQASGEYILPLDADDRLAPTYLEKAVPILDVQPTIGIVHCQCELFGSKTGLLELPPYQFPDILLKNVILNTALYRRGDWQQVGGYNPNMLEGWEDYDFWLSLLELGRQVYRIPEVLFFYRQHAGSRNQLEPAQKVRCYAQVFRNHPQLYTDNIEFLFNYIAELEMTYHRLQPLEKYRPVDLQVLQTIEQFLAPLHLRDINLAIFPDWQGEAEEVMTELVHLCRALLQSPSQAKITLVVVSEVGVDWAEEIMDCAFAKALEQLLEGGGWQGEVEVAIGFLAGPSFWEWKLVVPYLAGRLPLHCEQAALIRSLAAESLRVVHYQ